MSTRDVVVIGLSGGQEPLIRVLRERGVRIIGVDRNADAACKDLVDEFLHFSYLDPALDAALSEHASAPIALAGITADPAFGTIFRINRRSGAPTAPEGVFEICSDKFTLAARLQELGLPAARTRVYTGSAEGLPFPLIIKNRRVKNEPVLRTHSEKELPAVAPDLVVQELIEGEEYRIDLLPSGAHVVLHHRGGGIYAHVPERDQHDTHRQALFACDRFVEANGFRNVPIKFDCIVNETGAYIIDIGFDCPLRLVGLLSAEGDDYWRYYVDYFLDETNAETNAWNDATARLRRARTIKSDELVPYELRRPRSLARWQGGVVATDRDSNGIWHFNDDGTLLGLHTARELRLSRPRGLLTTEDELFVADSGHCQIVVLDSAWRVLERIDLPEHAPLIDSLAESSGTLFASDLGNACVWKIDRGRVIERLPIEGLSAPRGICVDGGMLYVADRDNDRVVSYNLRSGETHAFLTAGREEGQVRKPVDIKSIDESIYVLDEDNYRVQRFSRALVHEATYGHKGARMGEFDMPNAMCVDGDALLISDRGNDRVVRMTPSGAFSAVVSPSFFPGVLRRPTALAVSDLLYVADRDNNALQAFDTDGSVCWTRGGVSRPSSIVEADGMLFVIERAANTKGVLSAFSRSGERAAFDLRGRPSFQDPRAIAARNSTLYIVDGRELLCFGTDGAYQRSMALSFLPEGVRIRDVCAAEDALYVSDPKTCVVYEISYDGELLRSIDLKQAAPEIRAARSVAVFGDEIIACARALGKLYIFDRSGALKRTVGRHGAGSDQLRNPVQVVRGKESYYVVDRENDRIVRYSDQWEPLEGIGSIV